MICPVENAHADAGRKFNMNAAAERALDLLLAPQALWFGLGSETDRMLIALAAYAAYVINAGQFLLKLRAARLQSPSNMVTA